MSAPTAPVLTPAQLATGLPYPAYRQHIAEALATPAPDEHLAKMLPYYRQAEDRMAAITPTIALLPELQAALGHLRGRYLWAIITEGWCGDASHTVPVFEAVATGLLRGVHRGHRTRYRFLRRWPRPAMVIWRRATSCATRTPTSSTATSPTAAGPSPSR